MQENKPFDIFRWQEPSEMNAKYPNYQRSMYNIEKHETLNIRKRCVQHIGTQNTLHIHQRFVQHKGTQNTRHTQWVCTTQRNTKHLTYQDICTTQRNTKHSTYPRGLYNLQGHKILNTPNGCVEHKGTQNIRHAQASLLFFGNSTSGFVESFAFNSL